MNNNLLLNIDFYKSERGSAKADIDAIPYAYIQQETGIEEIEVRIYAR